MFSEFLHSHYNQATFTLCVIIPILILTLCRRNTGLVNYIPAFCASVGIFMTFLVLWITFQNQKDLSNSDNVDIVIKELSNKFSCSLIGIAFSILWNFVIKILEGRSENSQKSMYAWKQKDPQELLWNLVNTHATSTQTSIEILQEIRQLKTRMETSIETAHFKVSQTIHEATQLQLVEQRSLSNSVSGIGLFIQQHLEQSFSDLNKILQRHIEQLGTDALKESRSNVEQIQQEIKTVLADNLGQITTELKGVSSTISDSVESVGAQIQKSSQAILESNLMKLESAFEALGDLQLRAKSILDETTAKFAEAVSEYKEVKESNIAILQTLENQTNIISESQQDVQALMEHWTAQTSIMAEFRNRVADMANVVDGLQNLNNRLAAITNHQN